MSFSGAALAAKAKSMYGKVLSENDYEELIHKRSVSEITGYLKNETAYANVLSDVREATIHRGELENILKRESYARSLKLIHFGESKYKKFYHLHINKLEIVLLLSRVRVLISDNHEGAIAEFQMYLQNQVSFNLGKLLLAHSYDDLLEVVKHTKYYNILHEYRVKKGLESSINYTALEHDLWNDYYNFYWSVVEKNISGKNKNAIKSLMKTELELKNIIKIYRYKAFFNESDEVIKRSLYTKNNRLPSQFINELISQQSADGVLKSLAEGKYHFFNDDNGNRYIEYSADRIKYIYAKQQVHFSQSAPLVFASFVTIQDMELDNITNIIEGVRYNVDPDDIAKLLIY